MERPRLRRSRAILDYLVGWGIEFNDGGAARKLTDLSRRAQKLTEVMGALEKGSVSATGAFTDLGAAAAKAGSSVGDLAATLRAADRAASASSSGASRAAAGFDREAAAASRAASSVDRATAAAARFNAMVARANSPLFAGGIRFSGYGPNGAAVGGERFGALPPVSPRAFAAAETMTALPGGGGGGGGGGMRTVGYSPAGGGPGAPIPPGWGRFASLPGEPDPSRVYRTRVVGRPPFPPEPPSGGGGGGGGMRTVGYSPAGGGPGAPIPPGWGRFASLPGEPDPSRVYRTRVVGRPPFPPEPPSGGGGGGGGGAGGGNWGDRDRVPGPVAHAGRFAYHVARDAAIAGAAVAVDAVHEAGKFQTIMVSTQNITGANSAQMARVRQSAFDVGNQTGMSAVQTAEMFRELSRQSVGSMSFDDMLGLLPQMAKMQTVMGAARGFSPHQTVESTMSLVHLFRAYDPKGQQKMMDTVLRMGELAPANLSQAATQMTYFLPTLKNLHVSDEDAAAMMVALSRFGMGRGKGGTSVQNLAAAALGPLQMTKHAQEGKAKLLKAIGVVDTHGNSKFFTDKGGDLFGFLEQLNNYQKKVGSVEAQRVFESAFGKQGSRVADLMGDNVIIEQLKNIHRAIKESKSLGLDAQAKTIFGTAQFAEKRAGNNFQSLATEVGSYALPAVTKGFNDLADAMHNAQQWLHQHPEVGRDFTKKSMDAVKGTEDWINSHHDDWVRLRNDIAWAGNAVHEAGPQFRAIGDATILIAQNFQTLGWALASTGKDAVDFARWISGGMKTSVPNAADSVDLGDGSPRPGATNAPRDKAHLGPSATRVDFGPLGNAIVGNTTLNGPRAAKGRGGDSRHDTLAIDINVRADGGSEHANAIADVVEKQLKKRFGAASHPQHTLRRTGGSVTHRNLASVITVRRG